MAYNLDPTLFFGLAAQNRNGSDLPEEATTDNLPEGKNNLYFTKERVANAIGAKEPLFYDYELSKFSITKADRITDGYLAKTDWNTFNNKAEKGTYNSYIDVVTSVNFDSKTVTTKRIIINNGYITNIY